MIAFQGKHIRLKDLELNLNSMESIPLKSLVEDQLTIGDDQGEENFDNLINRIFVSTHSKEEYDIRSMLAFVKQHQTILLSDEPGMGKTIAFDMLKSKLKTNYPFHWVVLIDLKQHFTAFEDNNKVTKKFDSSVEVCEFIKKMILKISDFDDQVFEELFKSKRVIFLIDGVDEISPSFKTFVVRMMNAIEKLTFNQLWISTRPHLLEELESNFHSVTFKLKPFTYKNRKEFFKKFFNSKNKSEQVIEGTLLEIDEFLRKLKCNNGKNSVTNPPHPENDC